MRWEHQHKADYVTYSNVVSNDCPKWIHGMCDGLKSGHGSWSCDQHRKKNGNVNIMED